MINVLICFGFKTIETVLPAIEIERFAVCRSEERDERAREGGQGGEGGEGREERER